MAHPDGVEAFIAAMTRTKGIADADIDSMMRKTPRGCSD